MAIDIDLTIKTVRLYDNDFDSDYTDDVFRTISHHISQQFKMGFIPSSLIASDKSDLFKMRFMRMKDVEAMPIYAPEFIGVPLNAYPHLLNMIGLNWSQDIASRLTVHFTQGTEINQLHRFVVLPDTHADKWDDPQFIEDVKQTLSVERVFNFSELSHEMQEIIDQHWLDKSNNGRVVHRKLVVLSHAVNHMPIPGEMEIVDLAGFSHSRYS